MGAYAVWLEDTISHYTIILLFTSLVTIAIRVALVEQIGLVEALKVTQLVRTLLVVSQPKQQ